jgi:hypothetical protein
MAEVEDKRIEGHNKLMWSYFVDHPCYPDNYFQQRFRMGIKLFETICECVMTLRKCANLLGLQVQRDVAREFSPKG